MVLCAENKSRASFQCTLLFLGEPFLDALLYHGSPKALWAVVCNYCLFYFPSFTGKNHVAK